MSEQLTPTKPSLLKVNWQVFISAITIIFLLVGMSFWQPEKMKNTFEDLQSWLISDVGWFYVFTVAVIFFTTIVLGISRLGDIKLGLDHESPDYGNFTWFAMLFSTGMGIGLMFFGVAEPLMHFVSPPLGEGGQITDAQEALKLTYFHWGLHGWAIYAMVAIILAFFSFRHGLPLSLRSALYPLIKDKIYGPIGNAIDTFALLGTVFGVATSLGFGVLQINSGLNYLFDIPVDRTVQIILIIFATSLATLSVTTGLDKGIKILSQTNLFFAIILMILILLLGPTIYLLKAFLQNAGAYFSDIVYKSFNLYAYQPTDWIGGWTLFYWGWWLSWSPFVGLFIARISKGRSIREFVFGVLFVPAGFTFLWMTVFGNSAINIVQSDALSNLAEIAKTNTPIVLFEFLQYYPMSTFLSFLSLVLIIVFFVTSADSGALVIDMLASGGKTDTPAYQRAFWSITVGIIAIALLLAGGLAALQAATVASAFPFTFILLISMWGLVKALRIDHTKKMIAQQSLNTSGNISSTNMNWQKRMRNLMIYPRRTHIERFLNEVLKLSFDTVCEEFTRQGVATTIESGEENSLKLTVSHGSEIDFVYEVKPIAYLKPDFASTEDDSENAKYFRAEVFLKEGGQNYDIMGWTSQDVINDIVEQYERHLHFLHVLR
ncbi:BCCT family transporter [Thorsellia kenyensis]|uniref:BCCT family transporter n=1 Tax=Thorsellia kenyensis TaxID=1549888 RepID=A0ABV6CD95_9GAMM